MRTVQQEWQGQELMLVPKGSPEEQRTQTKLAFYAGVQATLRLLWGIGDDSVSEDAGVQLIESWNQECDQFAREWARSRGMPENLIDSIAEGFRAGPPQ